MVSINSAIISTLNKTFELTQQNCQITHGRRYTNK